jgi:hypothetical protein
VIISSGCGGRGSRLDPGDGFSSLGDEIFICIAIAATIFVHSIPSGNRGIGMSLFERKSQLMLLFGSYSRKSKKSKKSCLTKIALNIYKRLILV